MTGAADGAVRVIGVGSPFGADRLGWEAVELLRRAEIDRHYPSGSVSLQCLDRPGAALVESLAAPGLVILIDAMRSGAAPGTVRALGAGELASVGGLVSSHDFGIESALHLAESLGATACEVRILGIEMGGDGAGAAQEGQIGAWDTAELIRQVRELISNFLSHGR